MRKGFDTAVSRKYLSDPTQDVRIATENLLGDFLREVRDITMLQRRQEDRRKELEKTRSESASIDAELSKEDRDLGGKRFDLS